MMKKIDIGSKAKVTIRWNVPLGSYPNKEEERAMIAAMAKKYGIPEKNIKLDIQAISSNGAAESLATETVQNIQDPKFMQSLFKQYIAEKDIKDIDFDEIVKIDSQINALIDFDAYEKSKRYTIKWVKWSNFLSYGPDNFFDFTTLNGLVLLNGEPANKSGKSTFAYDLLHYLLFGKTNTNKAKTLSELFNNYIPDAKTINVEGCINIEGEDYIIRRTLTRSVTAKKVGKPTNKVEYYKVLDNGTEELIPDTNEQGESTTATSKIIKDALGNESDFDLIISANAKDLDSLISLTETERGRLLSRWIGLSIIEDKDIKAREKWNKEISVARYCDMYSKPHLLEEIEELTENVKVTSSDIEKNKGIIADSEKKIEEYRKNRDVLLSAKQTVDNSLLRVDAITLQETINRIVENGKRKNQELTFQEGELATIGDVDFSEEEYKAMKKENESLIVEMAEARTQIKSLKATNEGLAKAEFCPTCHRKLDNVDNSGLIAKNKEEIERLTGIGIAKKKRSDEIAAQMALIEEKRALYQKKQQIQLKIATIKAEISSQRAEYIEKNNILKEIQKNKDAIQKNSEIDAQVNVVDANIRSEETIKRDLINAINYSEREIVKCNESIAMKKSYIVKIDEERKVETYWKLYLQMIGKDGISKMVLRNTLPIINGELNTILGDVSDFRVEVVMDEKNNVDFILIRDDVITRLSAASGLEKTQAALALRVVLGKMSRLSKPPFILLDEVLGTVAKENYDDMKRLYDKIAEYYDFILHITHISDIVDWHDTIVTVKKEDNISSIK